MTHIIALLRAKLVHSRRGQHLQKSRVWPQSHKFLHRFRAFYLWLASKLSEGNKQPTLETQGTGRYIGKG